MRRVALYPLNSFSHRIPAGAQRPETQFRHEIEAEAHLLSRAQMACLHSTAMPSIRWVIRPSRLVLGVFASISGARTNAKPVQDEEQQPLDGRESPSDGSRAAQIRGAGVKGAGCGVSRGHLPSTPCPIWVMSMAVAFGTWQLVAFSEQKANPDEPNRQEGVLWAFF